jgi:hypothetical protein
MAAASEELEAAAAAVVLKSNREKFLSFFSFFLACKEAAN